MYQIITRPHNPSQRDSDDGIDQFHVFISPILSANCRISHLILFVLFLGLFCQLLFQAIHFLIPNRQLDLFPKDAYSSARCNEDTCDNLDQVCRCGRVDVGVACHPKNEGEEGEEIGEF